MKFPLLPVCLLLITVSCSKDRDGITDGPSLPKQLQYLQGSWQSYSYYAGNGSAEMNWQRTDGSTKITFRADSTYYNNSDNTYDHFILEARGTDTLLRLFQLAGRRPDTGYFVISINTNTLTLSRLGCIEGCGEKYVRQ